jgi:hypothetical protein
MKPMRALGFGIIIVLLIGAAAWVCGPVLLGTAYGLSAIPDMLNWRARTSPLEAPVVEDICAKLGLPAVDPRCQPGAVAYAPDFFRDITSRYREHDGIFSTYDEVQKVLGGYQYRYDPVVTTGDGLSYFRAHYDLKGDRVFPITMFFYEDGRVFRIIATVAD